MHFRTRGSRMRRPCVLLMISFFLCCSGRFCWSQGACHLEVWDPIGVLHIPFEMALSKAQSGRDRHLQVERRQKQVAKAKNEPLR